MILLILILQFKVLALSPEEVKCKRNQSLVDYRDPFNNNRILYCQEYIDGKLTQVGPKFEFNSLGEETSGAQAVPAPESGASNQKADSEIEIIDRLFSVFVPHSEKRLKTSFKTIGCRVLKSKVIELILLKKPFPVTFKFSDTCDLEGNFTVKLNDPFPLKLKMRNFEGYEDIDLMLAISFIKESNGVKVQYLGSQGLLKKADKAVRFSGNYFYLMSLNKNSNQGQENRGGEILVESINGKELNIKKKVYFE